MNIANSIDELHALLAAHRGGKRVALVPTMGCLHEGHLSLIRRAKGIADIVVVSIYVNPLQFGPNEDFAAYPRSFAQDEMQCRKEGTDILFQPQTLYPNDEPIVRIQVGEIADCLCGASRPGHFDGVATVVTILLNIVQPDVAVFGEKDWQQLAIIRRMAADLQLPVEIVGHDTVREPDGLAMSSRNRYLSAGEHEQAVLLSQALQAVQQAARCGERAVDKLLAAGRRVFADSELAPEYFEIRESRTLAPLTELDGSAARAFIACPVGAARLIDNIDLPINRSLNKVTETP